MPKLHSIPFKRIYFMKKLITILILAYLSFTINSSAAGEEKKLENKNILKIGVLLPLSGEYQNLGESFLKSIQLALYDISNKNIKIYPKDSKEMLLRLMKRLRNLMKKE